MPSFSMTPARITEPAVGAWVWASGSQVCSGKIGTLTAKAMAKARNSQRAGGGWRSWRAARCSTRSKVSRPPFCCAYRNTVARMPTSMNAEPAIVNRKNLTRGVDPVGVAPAADEEVHRHEHDLEEDEEQEQVEDEERAHARPASSSSIQASVRLLVVVGVGAEEGEREQQPGEHDEEQRDAVDAEVPRDAPLLDPGVLDDELEAGVAGLEAGRAARWSARRWRP